MEEKRKSAIFFDRDGVLNIDKGYVFRPADFTWVIGAKEAIKLANEQGFKTFVVTNQSGIARGLYTVEDMHALHDWMQRELVEIGGKIDRFYYCPYHDIGEVPQYLVPNHPDRKPNPGMVLRAIEDFKIDAASSLLIGDKLSDIEAAKSANVEGLMFEGGNLRECLENWLIGRGLLTQSAIND